MNDPLKKWRYEAIGKSITKTLQEKAYDAHYVDNLEEAKKLVLEMIPEGASIGLGGSVTINQMDILDTLRSDKYKLIDRYNCPDPHALYRDALVSDVFLTSTNAITKNGELVNMDCSGNRVAAITWGPEHVILVVSLKKVCQDLDAAVKRARSTAAPVNMARFANNTPCQADGTCHNCLSAESICNYVSIQRMSHPAGRHIVILTDEPVGY